MAEFKKCFWFPLPDMFQVGVVQVCCLEFRNRIRQRIPGLMVGAVVQVEDMQKSFGNKVQLIFWSISCVRGRRNTVLI